MVQLYIVLLFMAVVLTIPLHCHKPQNMPFSENPNEKLLIPGANQTDEYFPALRNKTVGVVANHTSLVGNIHLVDTLYRSGINIAVIFAPEHGFRGQAEAGETVQNDRDSATGIRIISLYGQKKKPSGSDLKGIEIMLFDIQDVGARFYTYISTLSLVMESCAANGIPLMILDRPNPNGFYTDGPVLRKGFESFVGMHPVPIVHGLTIAEYAMMVNGEGWLPDGLRCELRIIKIRNYTHSHLYIPPIPPSPNLRDIRAILLYPSLCLFEGTMMSVGRGTEIPFRIVGHPEYMAGNVKFTPVSKTGMAAKPLYMNQLCHGFDYSSYSDSILINRKLLLKPLLDAAAYFSARPDFFNSFFDKLAGSDELRKQIKSGLSEEQIRASWQPGLEEYNIMRKRYLLYPE